MITPDTIEKILAEFKRQGATEVYTAKCCDRRYYGRSPCTTCRTCGKSPENTKLALVKEPIDNPSGD